MKRILLIIGLAIIAVQPVGAQRSAFGSAPGAAGVSPYGTGYGGVYGGNPYGEQPYNPYNPNNPRVPYGTQGFNNLQTYASNGAAVPNNYGMPQALGNGFYGVAGGGYNYNMWKAPSGYYYPWAYSTGIMYAPTINVMNGAAQAAQPPLSTTFSDMLKYLDEQKDKGKLADGDYNHLKQRALDLLSKERDLRSQSGGSLDADSERQIRSDIDSLGGEMAQRVKL
jgi:hypothetical protein